MRVYQQAGEALIGPSDVQTIDRWTRPLVVRHESFDYCSHLDVAEIGPATIWHVRRRVPLMRQIRHTRC